MDESTQDLREVLNKATEAAGAASVDELAEKYGMDSKGYEFDELADRQKRSIGSQISPILDDEHDHATAHAMFQEAVELSERAEFRESVSASELKEHFQDVQGTDGEIGTPGTPFFNGKLQIEGNHQYRPFCLRGRFGDPGKLENFYRTEPVVRDSVDSITEIMVGARWKVQAPREDNVRGVSSQALKDWVHQLERVFKNIDGGWRRYVRNATNAVALFGFGPHEVVWKRRRGMEMPRKIEPREPATVNKWIMGPRESTLLGAEFHVGFSNNIERERYTLPARGPRMTDRRLIVPRIAARANNWEGTAPARTSAHWIKFKKLLGQIAAATAQKYGVPTTFVRLHEQFFSLLEEAIAAGGSDQETAKQVVDQLDAKEATDAAVVWLPDGLIADLQDPSGTMPDFEDLIRYCDEQIARPFSNEGSLIGHRNVGSYALAEVKDNKFMRSAPMYARAITAPINAIIREMTIKEFGGEMAAYPEMEFELDSLHDSSSFVEDMAELFAPNVSVTQYPKSLQKEIAQRAGLDEDVFEHEDGQPLPRGGERQSGKQQTPSAEDFQEDEGEESEVDETDDSGFRADDVAPRIDQIEASLAEVFHDIAEQQQQRFAESAKGTVQASQVRKLRDDSVRQFRPRYKDAIVRAVRRLYRLGGASLIDSLDLDVKGVDVFDDQYLELQEDPIKRNELYRRLPPPPGQIRRPLGVQIDSLASEVADRNASHLRDQMIDQLATPEEADPSILEPLALGTMAGIASKVGGRAFNAGRESTLIQARRQLRRPPRVEAFRSAMMDTNTCVECNRLDHSNRSEPFILGTSEYWANNPPAKCLAGAQCRCVMIHKVPRRVSREIEEMLNPPLVFRNPPLTDAF